jgi:hypothetical protein
MNERERERERESVCVCVLHMTKGGDNLVSDCPGSLREFLTRCSCPFHYFQSRRKESGLELCLVRKRSLPDPNTRDITPWVLVLSA